MGPTRPALLGFHRGQSGSFPSVGNMWFKATMPMISSGTASKAPNGPQNQVQKATARNTKKRAQGERRPTIPGVTNSPSTIDAAKKKAGAASACASDSKDMSPTPRRSRIVTAGPM